MSRSAQGQAVASINRCSRACLHDCCRQLNGWEGTVCA